LKAKRRTIHRGYDGVPKGGCTIAIAIDLEHGQAVVGRARNGVAHRDDRAGLCM